MSIYEGTCDKCGGKVAASDNILWLAYLLGQMDETAFLQYKARHLKPVVVGGQTVCEGSPSRAQYLSGSALDQRGQYPRLDSLAPAYQAAYNIMQSGTDPTTWKDQMREWMKTAKEPNFGQVLADVVIAQVHKGETAH